LLFLLIFAVLQAAWLAARDTWLERLVIHDGTVQPAAAVIRILTPDIAARAERSSVLAPGGGLNILSGCDGTELALLLFAAFFAVRLSGPTRLLGLGSGLVFVFVLNQARIAVLFYAYRWDKALFDTLHTVVCPVVLVAAMALFFYAWLRKDLQSVDDQRQTWPAR